MSETQLQDQNPIGSIQSPKKIEDSKMKVNEDNMEQSSPYPGRPGEQDCQFFVRTGYCGYGSTCRYNHPVTHLAQGTIFFKDQLPERIGQPDCEYFLKTGACKYGPTCKYHHPKDRNGAGPVQFNVLGFPMRYGEKSCPYYMQTGLCRFGVACKFHHPQPQFPNGHPAYAMSSFQSVGFPYVSGIPMMSFPPATYGAMTLPQVPQSQACMPFMVAPSQGFLPPQSWATYMGQPECVNFKAYGFCKFGASCKFDHSMSLNPYNNTGMAMSSQPTPYPYASPVSTHTSPPIPYDSTTFSNGKLAPESQSSETEKQDESPTQPEKSEVHDSSPPSRSDSIGKSDAENPSSESEKQDATTLPNGKPDAETEKQNDKPAQPDSSKAQDSSDKST